MPAPGGPPRPFITPGASPLRRSVETRSAKVLVFLAMLPKAVPFLMVVALIAGAVLLQGAAAAACLLVLAALAVWLLYLSWPALPPPSRLLRVAVVTVLVLAAAMTAVR